MLILYPKRRLRGYCRAKKKSDVSILLKYSPLPVYRSSHYKVIMDMIYHLNFAPKGQKLSLYVSFVIAEKTEISQRLMDRTRPTYYTRGGFVWAPFRLISS